MDSIYEATSYLTDFDSEEYMRYIHPTASGNKGEFNRFILDSLHELFVSGTVSGNTLLDVGTGVSVYSVISASRSVHEIHLSDLVPKHIRALKSWQRGEKRDTALFEYVVNKENDGTSMEARMDEVRLKVTHIGLIDVTQNLANQMNDLKKEYDIISSAFCFDSVSRTPIEYRQTVDNVATLLKTGGFFVVIGTLEESFYQIGSVRFWNVNIRRDELLAIYKDAGFKIVFWRERARPESFKDDHGTLLSDFKTLFVMAAQKF